MSLDQLSDVTISSNCLPSLNILSRQIVIGLPFLKPLKKYGTKLSVGGGGRVYLTYGDFITKISRIDKFPMSIAMVLFAREGYAVCENWAFSPG